MVDRLWSKSLPASTGCGGLRDALIKKPILRGQPLVSPIVPIQPFAKL